MLKEYRDALQAESNGSHKKMGRLGIHLPGTSLTSDVADFPFPGFGTSHACYYYIALMHVISTWYSDMEPGFPG
jgi:hypothetical protein